MEIKQLPSQVIPESQKGQEWMKQNVEAIKSMAFQNVDAQRRDLECWYMYHNLFNEKEFEYLTKISAGTNGENDYYLPAKVRHIPIQRSKLNVLISQQKHRTFQFSTVISNADGKAAKFARLVHGFTGEVSNVINERIGQVSNQITALEQRKQQMYQMVQQQPQTPEQEQQIAQIRQQIPMIEQEINNVISTIQREKVFLEKDYRKMSHFYQYEQQDIVEDVVKKLTLKLRQDLMINEKSLKNFISQVVVGKQYYMVDYDSCSDRLIYEPLNSMNVFYPAIDDIEWVQDSPWCAIKKTMSLNQAIDNFKLTEEEIKNIKAQGTSYSMYAQVDMDYNNSLSKGLYSGSSTGEGIDVYYVYWRSCKKIQIKKSPNPYQEGKYFLHFIDDEPKYFQEGQLYWDKSLKKYVDKKSGFEYDKKDVILTNKGEKLETRYIDEIYEGVVVGGIYKNMQKKKERLYSHDNYAYTSLPVFGPTFNTITDRPYSLVWDTKDIQKLYNLLNWHRELLLATSGVKGTIMDISQKPEDMSKKEWLYYKKLGVQWIETVKKHGRPIQFNQFGSYDDSLSASIQYIDNMLLMLDDVLGNIIGVGRQRQGQVSNSDQVATYQMAIQQNSLITEVIYATHDEIQRRAIEALINLAIKYKFKDGGDFDYQTDNLSMERFKITPDMLKNIDINVRGANNSLDEQRMKELKQFAIKEYDKGLLPFKDMIRLYESNTLVDLHKKFELYTEEAYEVAQRNAQAAANIELEKEKGLMQAQSEIDMKVKQFEAQMKQMELQLKANIEQMKNNTAMSKISADSQNKQKELDIKQMEIQAENIIEQQYINEQSRSNIVDERLRAIELKMNTLIDAAGVKVKERQSSMKAKEHISDR